MIANLVLFAISTTILFYVIKYRIHVYVSYEPRTRKRSESRMNETRKPSIPDQELLVQTLVKLGAMPKVARDAVIRSIDISPTEDFDSVLRVAIQECRATTNGTSSNR